jgi:hypothetical protein
MNSASALVLISERGEPMAYYRLYFLDGHTYRIREFREFEADDDLAALGRAASWRTISPMELWCGGRKVRNWDGMRLLHPRLTKSAEIRASWRSR